MVNADILGGLRSALAKGKSLKQTMISFYNAGYKKEEIEEAARALQTQPAVQPILQIPQIPQLGAQPITQPVAQPGQPIQPGQPPPSPIQQQIQTAQMQQLAQMLPTPQNVSGYGKTKKPGKTLIIILVGSLIFLIVLVVTIFLLKDTLAGLLNKLF